MNLDDYLAAIEHDGYSLAQAAEGRLSDPVPSCPGWDVAELVWHIGEVHDFWRQIAAGRLTNPRETTDPQRPENGDLIDWFRSGLEPLISTLSNLAPDVPLWTWAPQRNGAFIPRRMAQETAVHSWDARAAAGSPSAIEPELASDGIDEFLNIFLPSSRGALDGEHSVHIHCTDVEGEWTVTIADGRIDVSPEHAKGKVALRGSASDLLLVLWRRLPPDSVEILGEAGGASDFLALTNLE